MGSNFLAQYVTKTDWMIHVLEFGLNGQMSKLGGFVAKICSTLGAEEEEGVRQSLG